MKYEKKYGQIKSAVEPKQDSSIGFKAKRYCVTLDTNPNTLRVIFSLESYLSIIYYYFYKNVWHRIFLDA
jgi:hypothetical protein